MRGVVVERETLKPDDHIYSWRLLGSYAHHGVFVNEDRVIHYNPGAGQEVATGIKLDHIRSISSPSSQRPPCQVCGDQSMAGGVISSCLDCFLAGGELYLFQYGVSWPYFLFHHKRGTSTTLGSDESGNVLYRAEYLLENGFGEYNLVKNNCEDFALYCKTGKKGMWVRSGQVSHFVAALYAAVPLGSAAALGGLAAATKADFAASAAWAASAGLVVTAGFPLEFILIPSGMCTALGAFGVAMFIKLKIALDKVEPVLPMSDEWMREMSDRRMIQMSDDSDQRMRERSDQWMREMHERNSKMLEQHFEAHQRMTMDESDGWMRGHR